MYSERETLSPESRKVGFPYKNKDFMTEPIEICISHIEVWTTVVLRGILNQIS